MKLDHSRAAELLGAYALDAVDGDVARAVAAHVDQCEECRAELEEHRAVVGWIAGGDEELRQQVWSQIAAATASASPDRRVLQTTVPARSRIARWTAIAAVALLVTATGALVEIGHRRERREVTEELATARSAIALFSDPEAEQVQLRSDDGRITLAAAIRPDGTGVVVADDLPALPQDRTYQLWMITEGGPVSSGLLGRRPGVEPIKVGVLGTSALAVTSEPAGGASTPTLPPVVSGPLPSS